MKLQAEGERPHDVPTWVEACGWMRVPDRLVAIVRADERERIAAWLDGLALGFAESEFVSELASAIRNGEHEGER